jgi:nucleoside 2-deoxyribosyltransferase
MKTIYLASPLGFAASTRPYMQQLVATLRSVVSVLNPWDNVQFDAEFAEADANDSVAERRAELHRISFEIGRINTEMIDSADAVVAILDGVDVDSGTAAEIGYAYARKVRVYGLRTDFRLAGDNDGAIVNLQVQYFIEASGGQIFRDDAALLSEVRAWAT